mmetsp:Transcript_32563/g.71437  ORF Transcript_32563/g.71437 Transcript_32563/m.71437 type:complete len:256 (-) Transcript_32563:432-1199(-)
MSSPARISLRPAVESLHRPLRPCMPLCSPRLDVFLNPCSGMLFAPEYALGNAHRVLRCAKPLLMREPRGCGRLSSSAQTKLSCAAHALPRCTRQGSLPLVFAQERAAEWPALPPALLKRAKRSFVEAAPHPSRMQRSVAKALEALGFETRLEERTREGYSIDLMVLTRDGRSIAVEVDGPSHFLEESRTPTGATQLKRRQLRSFGHALVSLPFWEWEALHDKDPSERRRKQRQYLLTALRQRAPCQRKRAKTDVQ